MEDNLSTDGVYDMTASLCYRVMASFGGEIPKVLFVLPAQAAIQKRPGQLMPGGFWIPARLKADRLSREGHQFLAVAASPGLVHFPNGVKIVSDNPDRR
jgi:hypothetical protein